MSTFYNIALEEYDREPWRHGVGNPSFVDDNENGRDVIDAVATERRYTDVGRDHGKSTSESSSSSSTSSNDEEECDEEGEEENSGSERRKNSSRVIPQ